MEKSRELRTGRHCVFELFVHLVFVPKYRYSVFSKKALEIIEEYFKIVCKDFDAELREFNGEEDHIHCLILYPPKVADTVLVNRLKGASARKLHTHFPEMKDIYYKDVLWSPSYCAVSCGGAPLDIIKAYIEDQKRPD